CRRLAALRLRSLLPPVQDGAPRGKQQRKLAAPVRKRIKKRQRTAALQDASRCIQTNELPKVLECGSSLPLFYSDYFYAARNCDSEGSAKPVWTALRSD